MTDVSQDQGRKKERSPSYPGIDLRTALERAEKLRQEEGKNWAPINTVLKHWNYSAKSGPGLVTLAALKKFGLVEEQGSGDNRQVRLTDLARTILLDSREDSPEKVRAIREAALLPAIHAELWAEYHEELPSDSTLSYRLRLQGGFTDSAAQTFIREFRETLAFAKLPDRTMSDNGGDKLGNDPSPYQDPSLVGLQKQSQVREPRWIQLPVAVDEWASLQAAFPLTEAKWTQMLAVLEAMKPALVAAPEPPKLDVTSHLPPWKDARMREGEEEGED